MKDIIYKKNYYWKNNKIFPNTETIYGKPSRSSYTLKTGSYVFVSASIDYDKTTQNAFKDSVYWFVPEGKVKLTI